MITWQFWAEMFQYDTFLVIFKHCESSSALHRKEHTLCGQPAYLFHVRINSSKDDWKARRKDEKNKLTNTYGSVSLSFLGCTFHFLRMTQTILFLTSLFQSSSHFQKIAQFSGPHSTFSSSFLLCWCLLANKKIFETEITAVWRDVISLRKRTPFKVIVF